MFDLRLSGTGMCPVTKAYRRWNAGEDRRDALITILRNGRMHFQTAFSRFLISITIFLKISLPAPVSPDVLLSSSPSRPYGTNAQIYNHTSGILRSNGIPDVHGTACCSLSDIHRLLPDIQCMHIDWWYSVLSVQFQVPDKAVFQHHCACNPSLHKS